LKSTTSTKAVFSNKAYLSLAVFVAVAFWLISNISSQLIFFSPSLTFYWPIPESSILSFVLSNIIAGLIGVVVGMTVYMYRHSTNKPSRKNNNKAAAGQDHHRRHRHLYSFFSSFWVSGSFSVGVISSVCASCSYPASIFLFGSVFWGGGSGMMGAAAAAPSGTTATMLTSLLSAYQIPLQLASIVLLGWSHCYSASKILAADARTTGTSWAIDNKDNNESDISTSTSAADDEQS
jgi:uncharacterized membrane protein YsdA (DUF1294 family)